MSKFTFNIQYVKPYIRWQSDIKPPRCQESHLISKMWSHISNGNLISNIQDINTLHKNPDKKVISSYFNNN